MEVFLDLPGIHERVAQSAAQLGDLLCEEPRYQRIMKAFMDMEKDPQVRDLSLQIYTKRSALYEGKDSPELSAELQRINAELEALPATREYRAAESEVQILFHAVNALLSEALKVDFAANAKRGCGCGG